MTELLLTVNVGSTTVKIAAFALLRPSDAVFNVLVELDSGQVSSDDSLMANLADFPAHSRPEDLLNNLIDHVQAKGLHITACAHRLVHGGLYAEPQWLTPTLLAELEMLEPLCPLLLPPALDVIYSLRYRLPYLPQLAVFDTAFHRQQPNLALTYALPAELRNAGIQAYGCHGISCQYILRQLGNLDYELAGQRLVIAHLGSSASLSAVSNGLSFGNTCGFSMLDGLPMATRCGHLDSGVFLYLLEQGWSKSRLIDLLYHKSGLLGLSGISADMRELLASTTEAAHFAIDYFCYQTARSVASLAGALQGVDVLVFTGGIGEHQPEIRKQIVQRLYWLGVKFDEVANDRGDTIISTKESSIKIVVIAADEQQEMCWQSLPLLAKRGLVPTS